jgi:Zn-dependent protease
MSRTLKTCDEIETRRNNLLIHLMQSWTWNDLSACRIHVNQRTMPTGRDSIRLFKCFGIDVFLHWSWFLVAVIGIRYRIGTYSSVIWNVLEYLALFLIVLLHEFGHALACRSVGGLANQIVLWPFGGVAYAAPPPRPGATLWTIAAGPLVNVMLFPILSLLWWVSTSFYLSQDVYHFVVAIWVINLVLLVFNMLPVYPLDGGQILRALLWFPLGRAHSLLVATIVGFIGAAGLVAVAILLQSIWLGLLSVLNFFYCFQGFAQARELLRRGNAPRREGCRCPNCGTAPPVGNFWHCGRCRKGFDPFATQLMCPHCNTQYNIVVCLECGSPAPPQAWIPGETAKL